jgi:hypothetical protein
MAALVRPLSPRACHPTPPTALESIGWCQPHRHPGLPFPAKEGRGEHVNRAGSPWAEVSPPHTGRRSAGAAHSSENDLAELDGQG